VGIRLGSSPSCKSMAPMLYADALTWRKYCFSKSGCYNTRLEHIQVLSSSNALNSLSPQDYLIAFFVKSRRGLAIQE
jgi:hypothetical protein